MIMIRSSTSRIIRHHSKWRLIPTPAIEDNFLSPLPSRAEMLPSRIYLSTSSSESLSSEELQSRFYQLGKDVGNSLQKSDTKSRSKQTLQSRKNSKRPAAKHDWREWFRSEDYDNPWSPYYPLDEEHVNLNANQGGDRTVSSIMNGTWKRRRHGMNLEPLSIHSNENSEKDTTATADSVSDGETSTDKKILLDEEMAKAKRRMHWLDVQTRFSCEMLDDLYRTGIRRQMDRPSSERFHRIIGKMLTSTPKLTENNNHQPIITYRGLAQRAGAILHRMELCSPVALLRKNNVTPSSGDINANNDDFDQCDSISIFQTGGGSYQGLYPDYPEHLAGMKHALPAPTQKIYNMVLLLYAKESGPLHIAQQAEDVIWSMIFRFLHQPKGTSTTTNNLHEIPLPSTPNWNSVLHCWSISTDPNRGFHAISFLRLWMDWNKQCLENESANGGVKSNTNFCYPGIESFRLVLEACLWNDSTKIEKSQLLRAKELGSGVAIRLWKETEKSNITLDSSVYCQVVRAICQTSELPSTSSTLPALITLGNVFQTCCKDGMVSIDTLDIIRQSTTDSQFGQLIGNKSKTGNKKIGSSSTKEILHQLPPEWKEHTII